MFDLIIKLLLSYLIGSVVGGLVVRRLFGGVDLRREGSGNPGATNAWRTQGKLFALCVILIDILKGVLAVWLVPKLNFGLPASEPILSPAWLMVGCGAAVVLGHCYPAWFRFKGGKGAATLVGVYVVLAPKVLIPIVVVWLLTLWLTRYVGMATIVGGATAPFYFFLYEGQSWTEPFAVFAVAMALFVLFTHRYNIRRIRAGTEVRILDNSRNSD